MDGFWRRPFYGCAPRSPWLRAGILLPSFCAGKTSELPQLKPTDSAAFKHVSTADAPRYTRFRHCGPAKQGRRLRPLHARLRA